jgi:hypothetical protein
MPTPSRYDKIKKENPLATDLAEDLVKDQAMAHAPRTTFDAVTAIEKLKLMAQRGMVPRAEAALANVRAAAPKVSRLLGRFASPQVGAVIEIGRGVGKVMTPPTEGSFDRTADEGDKLRTQPAWYQVGKSLISTSDAFSQYGASAEREAKKAFESKIAAEQGPAVAAYMAQQEAKRAAENREYLQRVARDARISDMVNKPVTRKSPLARE